MHLLASSVIDIRLPRRNFVRCCLYKAKLCKGLTENSWRPFERLIKVSLPNYETSTMAVRRKIKEKQLRDIVGGLDRPNGFRTWLWAGDSLSCGNSLSIKCTLSHDSFGRYYYFLSFEFVIWNVTTHRQKSWSLS